VKLREYQEQGVAALRAVYASGKRAPVFCLPTGGGKTLVSVAIITGALKLGRRVLFNAHREELIQQTADKLRAAGITNLRMIQAGRDGAAAPVTVASVQTLTRYEDAELPEADLVIFDECFPAGTMIDGRPIETIRAGDLVRSFNHDTQRVELRRVKRLFCSRPKALVTVHLDDGRAITCTAGHPFFDGDGYTPAVNLKPGDAVYGASVHLHRMLGDVHAPSLDGRDGRSARVLGGVQEGSASAPREASGDRVCAVCDSDRPLGAERTPAGAQWARVLLGGMQARMAGAREFDPHEQDQQAVRERADESSQPDARRSEPSESECIAQGDRARTEDSRRQWDRTIADGSTTVGRTAGGLGAELRGAHADGAHERVSGALQDRHRASDSEGRRGDRWGESLCDQSPGAGREEAGLSRVARVDRVEVHERRGSDGFGPLCPDDLVYNIEVDSNHNYFADGVLVHNCHHVAAKTWRRISDAYSKAWLLGLTASPQRADGSPLGDVFDSMVVGATVKQLTELGHLVPCRVWAPPQILETGELAVSPVDAYLQHGQGERAITFCVTKQHAETTAAEFNGRGIPAAVVHGQLSKMMRAQILAWFREGQIRVICNVHVLTEGFDDPAVAVCILCRKPEHDGTYIQMAGRILRPAPGKTHATLIDLCGSSLSHGTPDMDRTFSLDGKGIAKADREQIRQCPSCGGVFLTADMEAGCCPQCGEEMPRREMKQPKAVGVGLVDASNTDQLRINLLAVAKRTRRTPEWVDRAHAAIVGRRAG
jgi:superfamily II DNA or RNA helicase